jgi:transposase
MIGAESNRRRHLTHHRVLRGLERIVAELQTQLTQIEREIDGAVRGTPAWREREDLLTSVPAIGNTIARTLIAEIPELGTLDRRKIASLAGLAPFNRDSGTLRGRRAIAGGRGPVRAALFMAVMVSIRHKLPLSHTYQRLRALGKPTKLAITACMRKLLTILNAILRDQKPWKTA